MLGNGTEPGVMFTALYWEEPDRSGHIFGPDNTTAMAEVLKEVDDNVGLLVSELKRTGLWGHINLIITSDHGMAQCSNERLIRLDDCLHPDNYTLVDLTPVAALIPNGDPDAVFDLLKKCHPHMTAYLKNAIPDRLHYRNNERIQPLVLIADEGWTIVQRGNKLPRMGDHGYDNSLHSMHPFLAAVGPSFHRACCRMPPRSNNGSLNHSRCLLAHESCWTLSQVIVLVVGVLLLLSLITALFPLMSSHLSLLQRPFQRLRSCNNDDDDDSLLE
ncbi:Bis(5'-adenosyl)-triphosphatase enpp4 [Oryzias melastigma]|uniref:bis(5'-adenosyl)-triphosphatase n=1 Tax=Oryzias melastigma TaxID=30732 RepID=A0A834CWT3_ORYME|nr:Bis(5'-adenosyl)-triphosphatase enpp4 [Oryzias melastigma]